MILFQLIEVLHNESVICYVFFCLFIVVNFTIFT